MLEWRVLWSDGFEFDTATLRLAVLWRDSRDNGTTAKIQRRDADGTWTDHKEADRA